MTLKNGFTRLAIILGLFSTAVVTASEQQALVLMSDFGTTERFVASMKGVAMTVDPNLRVFDLTHHIEPYNIWQASYVLSGTIDFWPKGTVFVSVVDPGVGTNRKSVVAKTKNGRYIVTPDNGTLTLIADTQGIESLREIDESVNRRPGSEGLHTFHGRDVYAYTGARLAAGVIDFKQVGPLLDRQAIHLDYQKAGQASPHAVVGGLIHIEVPYGNIVTNIPASLLDSLQPGSRVRVQIFRQEETVFEQTLPFVKSFGHVGAGEPLVYIDSLAYVGLAVNSNSFKEKYGVQAGPAWRVQISGLP